MADVFISYAREDEPKARQLADALTVRGWEVWWDRHIPPQTPNVVLLSERFWKEELNSDRSILGRTLILNSYGYSIRGVVSLPRSWDSVDILLPHKASKAPVF